MRDPLTASELAFLRRGNVLIRHRPRYPLIMIWLVRA